MKIIKNKNALTNNYVPDKILYREDLIREIDNKIKMGIGNLLLIGDTGTGKTISVRKAFFNQKNFIGVEINCSSTNTYASIVRKIIERLKGIFYNELGKNRSQLASDLIKVLKTKRKKKFAILFDEIDKLVEKAGDHQQVLIPILENTNSNLILISNRFEAISKLDGRIDSRLAPEKKIVNGYTTDEILGILKQRAEVIFEKNSYDLKVLAKISQYCYHTTRDIRDSLSLLFEIGQLAKNQDVRITLELFEEAKIKNEEAEIDSIIKTLTSHQIAILFGIADLSIMSKEEGAEKNKLYNSYEKTMKNHRVNPVGERQFEKLISRLIFRDLITKQVKSPSNRRGGRIAFYFPKFNARKFIEKYKKLD